MTETDPNARPSDAPGKPGQKPEARDPARETEPRSFGGEVRDDQEPDVRYGDDTQESEAARLADRLPEDEGVEGAIAADDVGASAMAERAGRDIEREGR